MNSPFLEPKANWPESRSPPARVGVPQAHGSRGRWQPPREPALSPAASLPCPANPAEICTSLHFRQGEGSQAGSVPSGLVPPPAPVTGGRSGACWRAQPKQLMIFPRSCSSPSSYSFALWCLFCACPMALQTHLPSRHPPPSSRTQQKPCCLLENPSRPEMQGWILQLLKTLALLQQIQKKSQ